MAGTLFVVATPIGHLDDITLRALKVLRAVAVVAAEDTRRTGNLLRHFDIHTPLVSLHAHNERARASQLIDQLGRGQSVALVSDAGTPCISDPGSELVRMARAGGIRVEAIPGPSAVAAAVSVAGLDDSGFAFMGFPPIRSKDRNVWLEKLRRLQADCAVVFFEAPHRVHKTLRDLVFLGERPIIILRELTKLHEESVMGPPSALIDLVSEPKGEFTIVVPMAQPIEKSAVAFDESEVRRLFGQMTSSAALSPRAAAREVGKKLGLSTRQVYDLTRDHPPVNAATRPDRD